ncbi:hypothetical protein [Acidovorax sp. M2(2025)]|uniref:hypothetical protein n=1 Tax=Acidovorax sp. M2(2025) TaxID=3411355 RepID=UPI003BF46C7F
MTTALPRRHFLASSGAAMAAGLPAGARALAAPAGRAPTRWRILGVAPASEKLPQLADDYRRGVELGLAQAGAGQVSIDWLSAGPLPSKPTRAIDAKLRTEKFDAVVGWMPPLLADNVAALAGPRGIPLWISDSGADMPVQAGQAAHRHPWQVRHSLELCPMACALAEQVYRQCGPRAFLALGWHESGYDFVQAFQHRWRTLGGQIVGRHIAGTPEQPHEFSGLREATVSLQPDVVVALFSGSQAQRFGQWWRTQRPARSALAGFPWLASPDTGLPAWTVGSWPDAERAPQPWAGLFTRAGLAWTPAALLGAEAGASLGAALAAAHPGASAKDVWAALHAAPLAGPRGERRWQDAGQDSAGPLWHATAASASAGLQHQHPPVLPAASRARGGWTTGYFLT